MSRQNGFFCENPKCGHVTEVEAIECYGRAKIASQQAKIDMLMLEYCPDDMTDEQWERWTEAQQVADDE